MSVSVSWSLTKETISFFLNKKTNDEEECHGWFGRKVCARVMPPLVPRLEGIVGGFSVTHQQASLLSVAYFQNNFHKQGAQEGGGGGGGK